MRPSASCAPCSESSSIHAFPVFKDTIDNILGFVFVKDLITLKTDAQPTDPIAPLLRPAYFVPETKRVPELLTEFQRKRVQSAIVVDEYGSTAGLVTIEDLLEEIVGEIRDEYDVEADKVVDEGDGQLRLQRHHAHRGDGPAPEGARRATRASRPSAAT